MKICLVCHPTHGGSGVVATELGKQLAKRGHEVHFVCYQMPFRLDQFYPNLYFHEVEVPTYPLFKYPPYALALASKITEVVKEYQIEVVHVHYAVPHSVCGNLARDMIDGNSPKVVTTLHGTDITLIGVHPSFYPITKDSMERCDALTSVSESLAKETKEVFEINQEINVIYNFIDVDEYQLEENSDMRTSFAPNGEQIVIHISNFRPVKRVTDVISTFNEIQGETPACLIMVGDGTDMNKAQTLTKEFGIEDKVYFLGKQDQIGNLLSISDMMLVTSEKESFGLVALEAMAYQIPVVATQTGGLPEVVLHNETGLLAPVGDIRQLTRCSLEILTNEEYKTWLGRNARQRVMTHFNADNQVKQYEKLYECLL